MLNNEIFQFNGQDLWLVSDTHFNHKNIIKYCETRHKFMSDSEREAFKQDPKTKISNFSVRLMNDELIEIWNKTIPSWGTVLFLGDFSFGNPKEIRSKLNGKIHFVVGNHDNDSLRYPRLWESINHILEVAVWDERFKTWNSLVCCHYPMRSWLNSHKGSFHAYGHEHGTLESTPWGRSMDVGIDNILKPISYFEFKDILISRPILKHH